MNDQVAEEVIVREILIRNVKLGPEGREPVGEPQTLAFIDNTSEAHVDGNVKENSIRADLPELFLALRASLPHACAPGIG